MRHVLAREDAAKAAAAKTHALGMVHAASTAFGVKDAHHGFNEFIAGQEAIIAAANPPEETDATQPTAAEIAFFESAEREALAHRYQ